MQYQPSPEVVVMVGIGGKSLNLMSARWSQLKTVTFDPPTKTNSMKWILLASVG